MERIENTWYFSAALMSNQGKGNIVVFKQELGE